MTVADGIGAAAAANELAQRVEPRRKLSILVSSTVYGSQDLLESIYALLETYGYHVVMSHKGTIPVNPALSAMDNCIDAVEKCDLFLGLILPRYGSGLEAKDGMSITHREARHAIHLNKPRWFLVHEHVVVARQLLQPFRDPKLPGFVLRDGDVKFSKNPIIDNLRVLELYEEAMRHDIKEVAERRGNWVQEFTTDGDARLFVAAQFRRPRDLLEKLSQLSDIEAIETRVHGGGK